MDISSCRIEGERNENEFIDPILPTLPSLFSTSHTRSFVSFLSFAHCLASWALYIHFQLLITRPLTLAHSPFPPHSHRFHSLTVPPEKPSKIPQKKVLLQRVSNAQPFRPPIQIHPRQLRRIGRQKLTAKLPEVAATKGRRPNLPGPFAPARSNGMGWAITVELRHLFG